MQGINYNSNSVFENHPTTEEIINSYVDNLDLGCSPLVFIKETVSSQGFCKIDNTHICVLVYSSERSIIVYDISNKIRVSKSSFTETQLGHGNDMCYADGYIYVATSTSTVAKLKVDLSTYEITWSSGVTIPSSVNPPTGIAYEDGVFYLKNTGDIWKTTDFNNFEYVFKYVKPVYGANQGFCIHNGLFYICSSGYLSNDSSSVDSDQYRQMSNQYIFVVNQKNETIKTFSFPRGSYGELESCDIITTSTGAKYIIVGCNGLMPMTANHGAVWSARLGSNTRPAGYLETLRLKGVLPKSIAGLSISASTTDYTEMGLGSDADHKISISHAILIHRLSNSQLTTIYVSGGDYNIDSDKTTWLFSALSGVRLHFSANITLNIDLTITNCSDFIIDHGDYNATIKGVFTVTRSTVVSGGGLLIDSTSSYPFSVYRGNVTGIFSQIDTSSTGNIIRVFQSNVVVGTNSTIDQKYMNTQSILCINKEFKT